MATTSLTFTLSSTNANLTLNGVAFTDNLPAGLVVADAGNLSSTCSGTATAVDGSSSISLSGASLAPGASCTVSVNVTGTTAGVKNNSVQVTSTQRRHRKYFQRFDYGGGSAGHYQSIWRGQHSTECSTSLSFTIQNNTRPPR